MLWLIETDIHYEDMSEIESIISSMGDILVKGRYVPFEKIDYKNIVKGNEPVMTLGSLQLCNDILRSNVKIGAYCTLNNFKCSSYYPRIQEFLLNNNSIFMPYGCLVKNKNLIYNAVGNNDCVFIRPDSGFKQFTGQVVEKKNFEKDIESFGFYDYDPSMICVIAEPVNIKSEFRFFVSKETGILGSSSYRIDGHIRYDVNPSRDMNRFVSQILLIMDWHPDPIYSMDIAELSDGSFRIVELNSFSASGLYGVDKKKLLSSARDVIMYDYRENYVKAS